MTIVRNPEFGIKANNKDIDQFSLKVSKFISVGRLVKSKDHKNSIKAFSLISDKFRDINFEIWGDGPEKGKLEKYIKKLGLQNRVILKGTTYNHSLIYSKGSVMITSTRYESDGISVRESVGYGIPVICFDDVPALKSSVSHFYNGIIISKYDRVHNLANALEIVLKNPKIFQSIYNQPKLKVKELSRRTSISWEELINSLRNYN